MPLRAPRVFAILTAVTVFCAHVLCACPGMWAKPVAAADAETTPATHHCCEHQQTPDSPDAPAESQERHCPHCDGDLVAPVAKAGADAKQFKPFAADLAALPPVAGLETTSADLADPQARSPLPFAVPATLLHLRCALNL